MMRILSALLLAALVTGCASFNGPAPSTGSRPAPSTSSAASGASVAEPTAAPSSATAALVDLSREQRADGDLARAAATVERALTIAPDDGALWVELAEIRFEQGDGRLAAELASKALTLVASGSSVAARAGRLIPR